jgi:TonB-dependent starch-binding outer membrane protein SusC
LLRARVPGLQVLRLPNGDYTLRIRGQRGFPGAVADEEPLLVIDDVPIPSGSLGTALAALAPRDIAQIDVLKDAGATAVYGTRGANGVIIIKTRRAP